MTIGSILLILGLMVLVMLALLVLSGIRFIPNNRVGIVEKRFGAKSIETGLIALKGEAGFQPKLLRGGLHYRMPIQYRRPPFAPGDHHPGQDRLRLCARRASAGADAGAGFERHRQ